MMSLSEVARAFDGAKQQGAGWLARCPAHDDSTASLSISTGEGGRILLHCHAGCTFDSITRAAALKPEELSPANSNGKHSGTAKREVAAYDYHSESGELLYQSVRYEPKSFLQRTRNVSGGWNWKLNGVRRVLYRLPEIVAADPEQMVFVVEGEKDVDRLAAAGILATTNAGGASTNPNKSKWLPEYSQSLAGRRIVILPDNDVPGRAHGQAAAVASLESCTSVQWLELPGLPEKGDVSDWLDAGGTVEQLIELADAAPQWSSRIAGSIRARSSMPSVETEDPEAGPAKSAGPTDVTYRRFTIDDLLDGDFRIEFIIDGVLVSGQPLLIGGMQKTLKTNIILDAAVSLASKTPMLNEFQVNRRCRVAVMTGESGMGTIQETVSRIMRSKEVERDHVRDWLILSDELPQAADVRHHVAIEEFIKRDQIELIIIDPAYLSMPSEDSGNLFKQGPVLRMLTTVCRNAGASLALCHHTRPIPDFRPAELQDLAWAGFKEFARQWWMLNRREEFDPDGAGEHKLWLTVGGSAGFNSLWGLDIVEGKVTDGGGRRWDVSVTTANDARGETAKQREQVRSEAKVKNHAAKVEVMKERIADALRSVSGNADSLSGIRSRSGASGNSAAFTEAFAYLQRIGQLVECEVTKSNKQPYAGYRYVFSDAQ
jgi:putative DNA primase/helicase